VRHVFQQDALGFVKIIQHAISCRITHFDYNNNQAFYSQARGARLEMKPHKPKKNRYKTKTKKKEKIKGDKKLNQKRRKDNKTLSQKSEKRVKI
jgi:hypothetical protein